MASRWDPPFWVGDRQFSEEDLELIVWTAKEYPGLSRQELANTLCENLPWKAPNGRLRLHSCVGLLEGLAQDGIIGIPAKRELKAYRKSAHGSDPVPRREITARLAEVGPVTVEPVPRDEQAVWDVTMAEYHPMGFRRAFGAHQRYWIYGSVGGQQVVLGAFLFAAAAKSVAARDRWLGWSAAEQQRYRRGYQPTPGPGRSATD